LIVDEKFCYINHIQICSWNQPVLSKEGKVACSRKQWGLDGVWTHLLRVRCPNHWAVVLVYFLFS